MTVLRTTSFLTASLLAGAFLLGCSGSTSGSGSASTTTVAPSTCEDLQAVASEIRGLANVNIVQTGLDGLEKQADKISDSLDALDESGEAQFGPQIDALKSSFEALEDTVESGLEGGKPLQEILPAVKSDLQQISDDWDKLESSAKSELGDCDLTASSS